VAGHGVAVIEVAIVVRSELDLAATVEPGVP
jgi:hypothetical protein